MPNVMLEQAWFLQKHPELHEAVFSLHDNHSKNQASIALESKENFLLSIALKKEKIKSYDDYPFSLAVIENLERTLLHPHVTYIVGENSSGKSTLLEALAVSQGFNTEGGTTNFNFSARSSHSDLYKYLRVAKGVKKTTNRILFKSRKFL